MRIYEELFIVRPDATEDQIDPLIEQVKSVITQAGGTVEKADKWGVRRLAYRVLKFKEGQYVLVQFTAKPETVKELERRLRVNDLVIKFLTVRIDEKLKRIEKRRKQREKRAARKPARPEPQAPLLGPVVPAAPAAPAAPAPGAPQAEAEAAPAAE